MSRFGVFLLALALGSAPIRAQDPPRLSSGVALVADFAREGELRASFEATADSFTGIWALSAAEHLVLEVFDPEGALLIEDGRANGQRLAWARLQTVAGQVLQLRITARGPGGDGAPDRIEVRLAAIEVISPPETKAALERVRAAADEVAELRAARDWESLRGVLRGPLESMTAEDAPPVDWELAPALAGLADEARMLGDHGLALVGYTKALEFWERFFPPNHDQILRGRVFRARCLGALGRVAEARPILEQVVAIYRATLPPEDPRVQGARAELANLLTRIGDYEESERLHREVLEIDESLFPEGDARISWSRVNLAVSLGSLGRYEEALALEEAALRDLTDRVPKDDPRLLSLRTNMATTLDRLGRHEEACAMAREILEIEERLFPEDHPRVVTARSVLASQLFELGSLEEARDLTASVLDARERTLAPESLILQQTRNDYATMLRALGDHEGARALLARVRAVWERTLPEDHVDLQRIRLNCAAIENDLGHHETALAGFREVERIWERTLGEESREVQAVRMNIASVLHNLGRPEEALEVQRGVLDVHERVLAPGDPSLLKYRSRHAQTLAELGRTKEAHELVRSALEDWEARLPTDGPACELLRKNHLYFLATAGDEASLATLDATVLRYVQELIEVLGSRGLSDPPRQVAARATQQRAFLEFLVSCASSERRAGELAPLFLRANEGLRALASRALRLPLLTGALDGDERVVIEGLRRQVVERGAALRGFLDSPAVPADADPDETVGTRLADLVRARELAQGSLAARLAGSPAAAELMRPVALEEMAAALPERSVGVSFLCYDARVRANDRYEVERRLVACVLARDSEVRWVELGPLAEVEALVTTWRDRLGAPLERGLEIEDEAKDETGRELHRRLVEPVLEAAGAEVAGLVLSLIDELHLLSIDSLPDAEGRPLGDRYAVHVVPGLEWLVRCRGARLNPPALLALGDVDFLGRPRDLSEDEARRAGGDRGAGAAVRTPARVGEFRELPFTEVEIRAIAKTFERAFDEEGEVPYVEPVLLRGRRADEARFRAFAPRARYLHLATHGWFAPDSAVGPAAESSNPWSERLAVPDFREGVRTFSPLSLCGLALSGASLPRAADGAHPGLLTGEEIASLDLSGVELAVLSACETHVGLRRAGQGIMSLREALSSAGVRHSITSLWKVPDEATMELMTRFYEGIWRRGESKREALWNAKRKLREAEDPASGEPRYGLKDWAGWVLVGNPE